MRRDGVVGVFWGVGTPRGRARRLRVHVQKKRHVSELSPRQLIADSIDGLRTRVVQVGEPRGHLVTGKDYVQTASDTRVSTITALVREDDAWYALVSGHGTLPIDGGAYDSDYTADGAGIPLRLTDVSTGTELAGNLLEGRLTSTQDFGIARLVIADDDVKAACAVTGTSRPPVRTSALGYNEPVRQFSVLDRKTRSGTVTGFGQVRLKLFDQNWHVYARVLEVHGQGTAFSRGGDSGSLVADSDDRLIGVVVGGSDPESDPDRSTYVLPFASETGAVSAAVQRFFS
jgi:hypothetical protein